MSNSATSSTEVTLTLEDGSTIQVSRPIAAQVRGIDADGDLIIRDGCTAPENHADPEYLIPLTPCCEATGKGVDYSDTGVACRRCYHDVDPKYGGPGRLAVRVATTNTVIMDGELGRLATLTVSTSASGPQTISLTGARCDDALSTCARVRAALARLGFQVYRNFEVHLDPPQNALPPAAAVATAVLAVVERIPPQRLADTAVLGDVDFDGKLRPVHGVLPAVQAARARGISRVIVPWSCRAEAGLADDVEVLGARSLTEIADWLHGNDNVLREPSPVSSAVHGG
ncbi:MAG: magnesium chelatase family protein [Pseudonocardiales bacterium]|jgi:hypothetical protein|nr:magnesium chelatase family protein [Pseudonocardiales bacterium]